VSVLCAANEDQNYHLLFTFLAARSLAILPILVFLLLTFCYNAKAQTKVFNVDLLKIRPPSANCLKMEIA